MPPSAPPPRHLAWHHRPTTGNPSAHSAHASLEWGLAGALDSASSADVVVVVDILSFSTAVDVATSRGIEVLPCHDEAAALELTIDNPGTALAVKRSSEGPDNPWSLSPAALARAPVTGRLALPSPNGSAISAAVAAKVPVVVACSLRNVAAVSTWLSAYELGTGPPATLASGAVSATHGPSQREQPALLGVVAAGERWPDGSLRPALEDIVGAGLLLHRLAEASPALCLSPAARLAARAVAGLSHTEVAALVRESTSGKELRDAGYEEDVEMAGMLDASQVVPVLRPAAWAPPAGRAGRDGVGAPDTGAGVAGDAGGTSDAGGTGGRTPAGFRAAFHADETSGTS